MSSLDFSQARYNMVEQQVRPWDVLDPRVLEVISTVPRESFVPEMYRNLAYADTAIPLDHAENPSKMMHPVVEGRLMQALKITQDDEILEVGTGSGYLTACLSHLGRHVISVDIVPEFAESAEHKLSELCFDNITVESGDASKKWAHKNAYDVIALTGSVAQIPDGYKQALSKNGRLFVITGEAPVMTAHLVTRVRNHDWRDEILFETCIDPLINSEKADSFVF